MWLTAENMEKIESSQPNPKLCEKILVRTAGNGFRILTWVSRNKRWEVLHNDQSTSEDRLAIHHWAYLP